MLDPEEGDDGFVKNATGSWSGLVFFKYCVAWFGKSLQTEAIYDDAKNARPENDGQRKLWVCKMQDWKMTDKNYGVWKNARLDNDGQNFSKLWAQLRGLENAGVQV